MKVTIDEIVKKVRDCADALLNPDLYLLADDIECNGIEQPSIDALIDEIDGLGGVSAPFATEADGVWIDADELKAIVDKYRGQK